VEVDKVAVSVLPQLVFVVAVLLLLPDTDLGTVFGGSTLNIEYALVELQIKFCMKCVNGYIDMANDTS